MNYKRNKIENLNLIKIDVQGYEPKALKGMKNIVKSSKVLTILTEFWPKGILEAGGNPKEFLMMMRKCNFNYMN